MDIGSTAYTEFKESADVISYRIEKDLLDEDIYEGLIHSHNSMSTFFSSTDCSTLVEEGTNMNHFVSLIVNNEGTYTAAVTRRVITESVYNTHVKVTETKYYNTYKGETVVLEQDTSKEKNFVSEDKKYIIEYFSLDIVKQSIPYTFADIDTRISEIKKSKAKTYQYSSFKTPVYNKQKQPSTSKSTTSGYTGYPYDLYDDDDDDDFYSAGSYASSTQKTQSTTKPTEAVTALTEIPLCLQETFDSDLVHSLCVQLLTGSINIDARGVDVTEWVKKMDAVYEVRFGYLDSTAHLGISQDAMLDNNTRLETWVEAMVEFLVYTRDEALLSRLNLLAKTSTTENITYDESDTAEVCAYCMYLYLDALPESYVKDVMLNCLATYIPNGLENYL